MLSLGLFVRLAAHADLSEGTGVSPLLVNLWTQAQKYRVVDKKLLVSVCVCVCVCARAHVVMDRWVNTLVLL